jgi:phosphoenolpyruvate synthase/pyruvate phosphate dikinase
MKLVLSLPEVSRKDRAHVGGKGFALAVMEKHGMHVPEAICISTGAYQEYVASTGLLDQIHMELYRKPFEEMRWEEIWDTALRIRNMFIKTPLPISLQEQLGDPLASRFSERPVSVRSSAPGEDSSRTSFAGLHESFINVRGLGRILEHIKLVWASLWSDRALLYRQELGLDVEKSTMAVVIQEMVFGERSGVVFGMSPLHEKQSVVEAVYGLNQGLVDGTVEADRWILGRDKGEILSHHSPRREKILVPGSEGARLEILPPELQSRAPLSEEEVKEVYGLVMNAESLFGSPQDVEWTYGKEILHAIQSRPITTRTPSSEDQRPWYLSLHRSFDNLRNLRTTIEKEFIPGMEEEAHRLSLMDLSVLSDSSLAAEIGRRRTIYEGWLERYKRDCIPFAHGMRLFGKIYNDLMKPDDAFQFTALLGGADMVSVRRNEMLEDLAEMIRKDPGKKVCTLEGEADACNPEVRKGLERFLDQFGDLAWERGRLGKDRSRLLTLVLEMTSRPAGQRSPKTGDPSQLEEKFLSRFEEGGKPYALELLDLARASYRLRDDDNIYLGRIEGQVLAALEEGRRRIERLDAVKRRASGTEDLVRAVERDSPFEKTGGKKERPAEAEGFSLRARQILGQPAGPGIAMGKARVVLSSSDLFGFRNGEILVCDAVDPGMTFVVPLASGIVERRGGMLIHGAIIAREYGIPCVTGVPDAVNLIKTGDFITVDGHLGIVIVGDHAMKACSLGETSTSPR